jgi:hypothetical protein
MSESMNCVIACAMWFALGYIARTAWEAIREVD